MPDYVNLNFRVTKEQRKQLKELALKKDTTITNLIIGWLEKELESEEREEEQD